MPRLPKKPPELWDAQKEHIRTYYIIANKTLNETMDLMKTNHKFDATKKEYLGRLASWQMSKNLKKDDWKLIHARNSAQKKSIVILNDREINPERRKRARGRYKFDVKDSFQSVVSYCSSTGGLAIRTPSPDPSFQADIATIPWLQFQGTHGHHLLSMAHALISSLNYVNLYGSPLSCYSHGELSMRGARSLLTKILGGPKACNDTDSTPFILQRLAEVLPRKSNADSCLQSTEPFFLLIQCCIYFSSNNSLSLEDMDCFLTWIFDSGSAPLFNQYISRLQRVPSPTLEIFLNHLLLSAVNLEKTALVSSLLEHKINPSCNDSHCREESTTHLAFISNTATPLQLASIRGNYQISRLLIRHGARLDTISRHLPFSPLELAISSNHGNFPIAEMMIKSGADINRSCRGEVTRVNDNERFLTLKDTERTLLMKAVEAQNVDITRLLLSRGAPVNDVSYISGTALQIATMKNDLDMLKLLLQAGAKVNIVDALEISARIYFESRLEETYYEDGDDDDERAQERTLDQFRFKLDDMTRRAFLCLPIQIATRQNKTYLVQRLLEAGATVNDFPDWNKIWKQVPSPTQQSENWRVYQHLKDISREWFQSALHESAKNGNVELTTLLLEHGAAVDSRNASGVTPLQLACGMDYDELEERHEVPVIQTTQVRINLARLFLSRGADVNSSPGLMNGRTALQAAVEKGDEELVALLLTVGANVNAPSSAQGGLTALQAASRAANFNLMRLLIHHGAVFTEDINWIALYVAASNGYLLAVEQLLEQGIDVNALYSPDGMPEIRGSVLQASIRSSNLDVVHKLLDAGADVNIVVEGETALCTAVRENDRDALIILLSHGANPNPSNSKTTPLAIAAAKGYKGMAECLTQAGADVDQPSHPPIIYYFDPEDKGFISDFAATPLFWTFSELRNYFYHRKGYSELSCDAEHEFQDIAVLLLSHGADPNRGGGNAGVLGSACEVVNNSMVEELLKWGANPNMPDCRGEFPIQVAARRGKREIVQLLLAGGADVNAPARELDSQTALECAFIDLFRDSVEERQERQEMVRILINAGAQIRDEGALLVRAIKWRLFGFAYDLIQNGVDVNCVVEDGSPLHQATMWGHDDLVQLLIDHGADINTLSSLDWIPGYLGTALQLAAILGHFNIAKLLIEKGANINAPPPPPSSSVLGYARKTALQYAAYAGQLDIVHLLLENDRDVDMIKSRCRDAAVFADERGYNVLARVLRDYTPQRS